MPAEEVTSHERRSATHWTVCYRLQHLNPTTDYGELLPRLVATTGAEPAPGRQSTVAGGRLAPGSDAPDGPRCRGFETGVKTGYGDAMATRRLPLGIQNFRELRELDCYYVDKTAYVKRLLDQGKYYILSRPRRFGKSLFLDTLKELFEGSEELFAGLYIHDRWTWSTHHPVVRLSFGGRHFAAPGDLDANLAAQLDDIEVEAGVTPRYQTAPERFGYLIRTLHRQTGSGWWCWSTSTPNRSWTCWRIGKWRVPTATSCAASTG